VPKPPLDDHTEPAFDDEPESATESIARELLVQLRAQRSVFDESTDGATRTDAPLPVSIEDATRPVKAISLEPAVDAHDQATKLVPPIEAVSLAIGDMTSDGLQRLHQDHAGEASEFEVEVTSPGLMPAPKTGADAMKERRGDIAQLLASIAPFLWSLEAAEKWVRDHANGDAEGEAHARSLALLARVLGQLQARIDEAARHTQK
jgi:hypothetical protein